MSKTIFLPCSNFSLSVTCLLFWILFFFLDFFSCSCLILASFGSRNVFSVFFSEMLTHVTLLLSAFLQLHLQFELFLLLAFCERATRSPSPALSLGILCKSICICMCGKQLGIGALYIKCAAFVLLSTLFTRTHYEDNTFMTNEFSFTFHKICKSSVCHLVSGATCESVAGCHKREIFP